MDFLNEFLKLMHKLYKKSLFINDFFKAIAVILNKLYFYITRLANLYLFNLLDEEGCKYWEERLKLKVVDYDLNTRRGAIRAKWLIAKKSNLEQIQKVCDSWENGKIKAIFEHGIIDIRFISDYGIPPSIESLKNAIDDIKPAHLGYHLSFKYLLIKDIHEVKTLDQLQRIQINNFALGIEE